MARFSATGTWDGNAAEDAEVTTATGAQAVQRRARFEADPDDTPKDAVLKFISRNVIVIISAIIFLVTVIAVRGVFHDRDDSIRAQEAQVLQLEHNVEARQAEEEAVYEEAVQIGTSGVDIKHKREDDAVMESLMRTALEWNGTQGYLSSRKQIADKYNFTENSQFLSEFMPGEMQGAIRKDPTGEIFSVFDNDISSKFAGFDSIVVDATADVYSYSARAIARQVDQTGTASVDNVVYLRYRVIDGNPTDVEIYTNPMGVTKSG